MSEPGSTASSPIADGPIRRYVQDAGLRLRFVCRACGKDLPARAIDATDEACRFVQRYEIEAGHECSPESVPPPPARPRSLLDVMEAGGGP